MNAVEFVKKYGWDYAKHILSDDAPLVLDLDYNELKRLVESYELVEKHGGVNGAIEATGIYYIKPSEWDELNQAIRDVEEFQ